MNDLPVNRTRARVGQLLKIDSERKFSWTRTASGNLCFNFLVKPLIRILWNDRHISFTFWRCIFRMNVFLIAIDRFIWSSLSDSNLVDNSSSASFTTFSHPKFESSQNSFTSFLGATTFFSPTAPLLSNNVMTCDEIEFL